MMDKKEEKIIVIRDNFILGVLGDAFMYGSLLGLYWFNYHYLGNNGVLNVIFSIIAVMFIANLFTKVFGNRKEFYSNREAIEYLEQQERKKQT
jgi:hypothetical protein